MGIGLLLVSTFSDALRTSIQNGFTDGLETYGLVSGLWTSVFALGAFIGPSISGALYDSVGFRKSVYFIIVLHVLVAFIFITFLSCSSKRSKLYKEISAEESLIKRSRDDLLRTTSTLEASQSQNTSFTDRIPIPIERGCAMNNLIMASSYGSKGNHWQRMEETSMGLLSNEQTLDGLYGSFDDPPSHHRETIA